MDSVPILAASCLDHLLGEEEIFTTIKSTMQEKAEDLVVDHVKEKLKKIAPTLSIIPTADEKELQKVIPSKAYPILILQNGKKSEELIKNLARALTNYFSPTSIINVEENIDFGALFTSPSVHLIISWKSIVERNKQIKRYFTEVPSTKKVFIQQIPLYILPDNFYKQDPMSKKAVWNDLCQMIQNTLL